MKDARDGDIYIDENGVEHYQDSDGEVYKGMPPLFTSKSKKDPSSGWTI